MKFTKATDYALHAIALLAKRSGEGYQSLSALANQFAISPTYLSKILTLLTKANLIRSSPGVAGGYSLQGSPTQISFLDVIEAIEGHASLFECAVHEDDKCAIHKSMAEAERILKRYLADKTIADLMAKRL